jgi:predicted nucleic acid-binding protein
VTIDTNVLVYALDLRDPQKHEQAVRLVEFITRRHCLLTYQVLGEFCAAVARKNLARLDEAEAAVAFWASICPVVSWEMRDLATALSATRRHSMSFWDAVLWATVRSAGCRWILTEDFQHGREVEGVCYLNPFRDRIVPEVEALFA